MTRELAPRRIVPTTPARFSLSTLLSYFRSVPRAALAIFAVALVVVVGGLDMATGDVFALKYLYLIPVLIIACSGKTRSTLAVIGFTVIAELTVDVLVGRPVVLATAYGLLGRTLVECIVAALVIELQALLDQQTHLAQTDPLTGLANRRVFFSAAAREIARQTRNDRPIAILYMDLDGFKQLNDEYGHAEGDALLTRFAEHLQGATRTSDVVARLGGDEFAILLPEADREAVEALAERIERTPGASSATGDVGVSIGVVAYCPPFPNIDTMLAEAEWLMYKSKRLAAVERRKSRPSIHWANDAEPIDIDLRQAIDVRDGGDRHPGDDRDAPSLGAARRVARDADLGR
jgi:diguanylate cyclase (GGDEF)-like protein